jgi:hypothetical protein
MPLKLTTVPDFRESCPWLRYRFWEHSVTNLVLSEKGHIDGRRNARFYLQTKALTLCANIQGIVESAKPLICGNILGCISRLIRLAG